LGSALSAPLAPRRREVVGYCMYDFANSSYTTLIVTVAYSVYFRQAVVGAGNARGDLLWSLAQVAAFAVLILTSPVLGALADHAGRRKAFLLLTTIQTVVACALLGLVGPGDVALGLLLYVIGTVGFDGGYIFYNALLPSVSTPRTVARVSALSWGTGFIGGLAALVACMPLLAGALVGPDGALVPASVSGYRWSFVVVAAFFAVFSIPTFVLVREPGERRPLGPLRDYVGAGFRRVADTLRHLRRYRQTGTFVLATLFYAGGIETVIKFSAIYASLTFGIEGAQLVLLFIVTNIIAVPGTILAGWLADRIGGRVTLALTLVGWIVLVTIAAFTRSVTVFWFLAGGIAIGMGATQAVGRSFMSQISPAARESEFFGFYVLTNKVGSIVAFLLFGLTSAGTGNQRLAVLWLVPLFVVGLALVLKVDEGQARAMAAAPPDLPL